MYQFENNKEFIRAVKRLALKHNVYISKILSVAKNAEKNKCIQIGDINILQNIIGIPISFYISRKEVRHGIVTSEMFQKQLIEVSKNDYSFEKLDTYPNFIWKQ